MNMRVATEIRDRPAHDEISMRYCLISDDSGHVFRKEIFTIVTKFRLVSVAGLVAPISRDFRMRAPQMRSVLFKGSNRQVLRRRALISFQFGERNLAGANQWPTLLEINEGVTKAGSQSLVEEY